jgi:hypothetical protein
LDPQFLYAVDGPDGLDGLGGTATATSLFEGLPPDPYPSLTLEDLRDGLRPR